MREEHWGAASAVAVDPPAIVALRRRNNWLQLGKFCGVGATGYLVNLAVHTTLLKLAGLHYIPAATGSFLVAATNNYVWNRRWTFRGSSQRRRLREPALPVRLDRSLSSRMRQLGRLVDSNIPTLHPRPRAQ